MSLVLRLMIGVGVAVLLSLLATVGVIATLTNNELGSYTQETFKERYEAKATLSKTALLNYFSGIEKQIIQMASDTNVKHASAVFNRGLKSLVSSAFIDPDSIRTQVSAFYRNEFSDEYTKLNPDRPNVNELVGKLDAEALLLQYYFIVKNSFPLGSKIDLFSSELDTQYNKNHEKLHGGFKSFIETYGYYDVFIADSETGRIVYSAYKETDFGTSLIDGPFADSGIAEAFVEGNKLNKGETYVTHYAPYLPSYNNMASFISSPIFNDNGERTGVLIFQMPVEAITALLTQNAQWEESGFGETGEAFVVGDDFKARSEIRQFVEDGATFVVGLEQANKSFAKEVEVRGTTLGLYELENDAVRAALNGETGFMLTSNYADVTHLTAYTPVNFGNVRWALIAEIEQDETTAVAQRLNATILTSSLIAAFVVLVLAGLGAVMLARVLAKPLVSLATRFDALNSADADLTTRVELSGVTEIDDISRGFNGFIEQVHGIVDTVKENADYIASASTELSAATVQASASARAQLEETEKVTDSLQQFNIAIDEVASQGHMAADRTTTAKDLAGESSAQSGMTNDSISSLVTEISDAASNLTNVQSEVKGIVDVLSQITSIADQTNLLALNAAIEAARAGESGRGFAVVADEVRSLAMRTQESTVQIQEATERLNKTVSSAVGSMGSATNSASDGIDLVNQVASKIAELDESVSGLAEINESVAAAAEEQKYTAASITENVDIVTQSSIELSQSSDEVATSSNELARIAVLLSDNVKKFKT